MCFRRKKFEKIDREEIVDAICSLEKEEKLIEDEIKVVSEQIKTMIDEGQKLDTTYDKIFLVKKITNENDRRVRLIKRGMFVLYNIKLTNRLKDAIDDNIIVNKVKSLSSFDYLKNQKELAIYLNELLNTKTKTEDILTEADDAFVEVEKMFLENTKIYGITDLSEDKLMAIFETNNTDNTKGPDEKEENKE
ncbi:MAG: hypothetical protein MSH40_02050 [Christensenella sp.]|nr:hypothetical protein [Christensenella sp.]